MRRFFVIYRSFASILKNTCRRKLERLLAPLLLFFSLSVWGQFQAIEPEKGQSTLGVQAVLALSIDDFGAIWIGGQRGLFRHHQGQLIKVNPKSDANSNLVVLDLITDHNHILWVGSTQGAFYWDMSLEQLIPIPTAKPLIIEAFATAEQGVYAATRGQGLWKLSKSTKAYPIQVQPHSNIYTLLNVDQTLWFGTDAGVYSMAINQAQTPAHRGLNDRVRHLLQAADGAIWAATDSGLFRLLHSNTDWQPITLTGATGFNVRHIEQDAVGNFWVATDGAGIYQLNAEGALLKRFAEKDDSGLFNNKVRALFIDQHKNLWAAHYPQGLSLLSYHAQRNFHLDQANSTLTNSDILSLTQTKNTLWVGTENGLNAIDLTTWKLAAIPYDPTDPQGLPKAPVFSLSALNDTTLAVASWQGGVSLFDVPSRSFSTLIQPSEVPSAFDLVFDKKTLWVASTTGLYSLNFDTLNTDKRSPEPLHNILNQTIFSLTLLDYSRLLAGGIGQIFIIDTDTGAIQTLDLHATTNIEKNIQIRDAIVLPNQKILLATSNGLILFDPSISEFTPFSLPLLEKQAVNCVVQHNDRIWALTDDTLIQFESNGRLIQKLDYTHGVRSTLYKRKTCALVLEDKIVAGGNLGLSIVDTKPDSSVDFDFNIHANLSNEKHTPMAVTPDQAYLLPSSLSDLRINITTNELAHRATRLYTITIHDVKTNTTIKKESHHLPYFEYPSFSPGEYLFEINATNHVGVPSNKPLRFTLTYTSNSPIYYAISAILLTFFALLMWFYANRKNNLVKGSMEKEDATDQYLPQIQKAMENDQLFLDNDLSLDIFSKHVNLPTRKVSKTINTHLNQTFLEFVSHYRIECAKRLLVETDKKIIDIMLESGFNSKATFYRLFKDKCGISPTEYRKINQQKS